MRNSSKSVYVEGHQNKPEAVKPHAKERKSNKMDAGRNIYLTLTKASDGEYVDIDPNVSYSLKSTTKSVFQ